MKKMKRNKSGISLIVLVITIIVMIILASAVIISLDNSNIIGKTSNVVKGYNLVQIQTAATLIWADEYVGNEENLNSEYIRSKLEQQGIKTGDYDIIVSETGVVVKPKEETKSEEGIYYNLFFDFDSLRIFGHGSFK